MKKFEFRLASVLRLRDMQLSAEQAKLAGFFAERVRLEKNLASIADDRQESLLWVQQQQGTGSTELHALSAFLLGVQAREATVRDALRRCEGKIAEQRQRVILADRNQRLLIKLKEKKLAGWQHEVDLELETLAQEVWQSAHRKTLS